MHFTWRLCSPRLGPAMLMRARPFKVEDPVLQNKPVRRVQKIVIKGTAEVHHLSHVHQHGAL